MSFSVIEENLIVLDSRLSCYYCYYCIWSELVVFLSVESKFSIPNRKVSSLSSFCLEKELASNVTLKNNSDLRLAFFYHSHINKAENKYIHVHLHLDCFLV